MNPCPPEIIIGYREVEIVKNDGSTEVVRVRLIPLREMNRYAEAQANESDLADFLCGRPHGWSDHITDDSIVKIVEVGSEINDPRFFSWAARTKKRAEALQKLIPS